MDLNTLTLKELKKLRKDVDKTINDFENRKKREALAELEKKAAEMGFSLSDLTSTGKIKTVSAPKYANPADSSQTWTGRGRIPQWMKALEAAGGSRDDTLL
ncbi:H-NS family nucleoid-associated regulatory protein [Planktotalea arctica]|uniref:H-NS histone family protein n=1 Tax=Planktotalea arctica TaxID=1481893 RepID=UPI000A16F7D3|nr:H-NS histone family protein [Planktotalea arctica]